MITTNDKDFWEVRTITSGDITYKGFWKLSSSKQRGYTFMIAKFDSTTGVTLFTGGDAEDVATAETDFNDLWTNRASHSYVELCFVLDFI